MKGIISAILFIGAAVAVRQYAFPAVTHIKDLRAQLAEMESLERRAVGAESEREKAITRLQSISESNLAQLDLILPERPPTEDLYVFFDLIARQSGFAQVDSVKVGDASSSRSGEAAAVPGRKALTFDISVSGTYANIRRLIEALEKNARLADVRALDITANAAKGYSAKIQGSFYYVD